MKIFYSLLLVVFLSSCNSTVNNKKGIELRILSSNLKAYCIDSVCSKNVLYTNNNYDNYFKKSTNIVRFKIINKSNSKFIAFIKGLPVSSKLRALFLEDLLIKETKTLKKILPISIFEDCIDNPYDLLDSTRILMYKKLGYKKTYKWYLKNGIINESLIYLEPNEVKYFELYVNLPINSPIRSCTFEYFKLNKKKNYDVKLNFHSDTTNIKKYLTWSQLKNIEENNYKLYQGTIISENSVPIVFVDE